MRYIHDGELKDRTIDLPTRFVFDEPNTSGRGRTVTAAHIGKLLSKQRKGPSPLIVGHDGLEQTEIERGHYE